MKEYDPSKIEKKWQKEWDAKGVFRTDEDPTKPKCYVLDMFPYPSGDGLHVGHPKGYIATDVYSRYKHMTGHNILHPMGWDAFGLPAEQYAIKNKVHPSIAVDKNVAHFKDQLSHLGFNYDWSREVNTTDPKFYKWTQWIFKQLYKKGLAYESFEPINWCPVDKTGLSNEDLENGRCERCGSPVEKKALRQWVLKITAYADRMLADLDGLNWPEHIKESQRNWIGKSDGAEIEFTLNVPGQEKGTHKVSVFTTRPDTLFGATYLAISAELAQKWIEVGWGASDDIKAFIATLAAEEKERAFDFKEVAEKKGIDTGVTAINPANGNEIPVWIANYILSGYGTGAIMAVPAHDERDNDFATKYGIPVVDVIGMKYVGDGIHTERTDVETVSRKVVDPILRDKEGNFYLIKEGAEHIHFAGGGVDEGESEMDAVRREITEETGFTDFEILKRVGPYVTCWGYRHTRNRNQRSLGTTYEVVLNSDAKVHCEVDDGKHELIKVRKEDMLNTITWPHHHFLFAQYLKGTTVYTDSGVLLNSGKFDGMESEEARKAITEFVGGKLVSQYRLKEWVFARQRYWGEPFPVVFDKDRKPHMVADSELPVVLPNVESYEPTDTGESPLANIREWVEVYGYLNDDKEFVSCDKGDARASLFERETNTMPQWAGSSWYYLRYIDPTNDEALVDKAKDKSWSPVDFYVGGAEHATRHLIYARFWHKFLFDIGIVNYPEPFLRLQNVGLIMADDGRKMSKRYGNVINPDDVVATYGADSLRVYEMFMGPFDQSIAWSTDNMMGARRFIERVWRAHEKVKADTPPTKDTELLLHQAIKKVGEDIESFSFNTAISQLMILMNHLEKLEHIPTPAYGILLQLLAPFAPHVADELWAMQGKEGTIYNTSWPTYDPAKLVSDTLTIAVQVNGKLRDTFTIPAGTDGETVKTTALARPTVTKWLDGMTPKKVIYVPGKIVNIVL